MNKKQKFKKLKKDNEEMRQRIAALESNANGTDQNNNNNNRNQPTDDSNDNNAIVRFNQRATQRTSSS